MRHGKSVEHDMNVCAAGLVPQIRIFLKLELAIRKAELQDRHHRRPSCREANSIALCTAMRSRAHEKNGLVRHVFTRRLSAFRQRLFGVQIIAPRDYAVLTFRSGDGILIRGVVVEYAGLGIFVQ
jgi:hypothetical protein